MAVLPGGLPWVWGSQISRLLPACQGRWAAKGVRQPTRQLGMELHSPPLFDGISELISRTNSSQEQQNSLWMCSPFLL